MSLPETCPFCGAERHCEGPGSWVGFTCLTSIHAGQDIRRTQSRACEGLERTRLLTRIAELEAELEQAKEDRARAAMDARNPLLAHIAALEAEAKQARDDEAWAHDKIMPVDFAPVESGWEAGWWDGEKRISATAPTIHAALRALRQKVEGGTR